MANAKNAIADALFVMYKIKKPRMIYNILGLQFLIYFYSFYAVQT